MFKINSNKVFFVNFRIKEVFIDYACDNKDVVYFFFLFAQYATLGHIKLYVMLARYNDEILVCLHESDSSTNSSNDEIVIGLPQP